MPAKDTKDEDRIPDFQDYGINIVKESHTPCHIAHVVVAQARSLNESVSGAPRAKFLLSLLCALHIDEDVRDQDSGLEAQADLLHHKFKSQT